LRVVMFMRLVRMDERVGKDVVRLYCEPETWGYPPWNEAMKCASCGRQYGVPELEERFGKNWREMGLKCECGGELKPFWSPEEVEKEVREVLERGFGLAFYEGEKIVGFTMGVFLKLPEVRERYGEEIAEYFRRRGVAEVFYAMDTAVRYEYRGKGLGTMLVRERQKYVEKVVEGCFGRTKNPVMIRILEKNGFERTGIFDPNYPDREFIAKVKRGGKV